MTAGAPHKPPALVKVPVGLKLPRWLLDWMRQQDQSMAVLIEDALCKRHKLKPPNAALRGSEAVPLESTVMQKEG